MTPSWQEWQTASDFRIRVAPAAVERLAQLSPEVQTRLRQMMQDIAELAQMSPSRIGLWRAEESRQLLHLRLGRIDVRYTISAQDRTLIVEHVVVPQGGDLDQTG